MRHVRVCGFLLLATCGVCAQTQDDVVFRAMRDELNRSMKKLQLEQMQRPYFISYRVVDNDSKEAGAGFGALMSSSENRGRFLTVSVRVGDYSLDNSNFFSLPMGGTGVATQMFAGTVPLPLDANYDELRRQMWLATDGAYKKALEDLSGKRAALENKRRTDNVPDFGREKAVSVTEMTPRAEIDLHEMEGLARELSAVFRQMPAIETSHVAFTADNTLERFLTSEGATFTREVPLVWIRATASTQAADGMPLSDSYAVYRHSAKQLPGRSELLEKVRAMAEQLSGLQKAPVVAQYNGPVLFEDQAAAEIFARVFVEQLPVEPELVSDNPQLLQSLRRNEQASAFLNKIGARVLPEFLSVVDNPTAAVEASHPLMGYYKVDEEGTPAQETVVVENGVLKTLLTSRALVPGISHSTGNLRGRGVAPSNVFLNAARSSPPEELKKQLVTMAKSRGNEYGIVVRRLASRSAIAAYRVYPDGHEELIRDARLSGVNAASFKDIVAVSNTRTVYTESFTPKANSPINFNLTGGGTVFVSYVTPSLLFDDMTVHQPSGEVPKPPVLPHPFFAKK